MALDPLKFAVQITDEATNKLNEIKRLIDGLQDKSVNINVSGNLGELLNLFKDGVDTSKFDNLKTAIGNAVENLGSLNKVAKESNFDSYSEQIGKASNAVSALSNAIANLSNVAGSGEGMQKFMVAIGEVVTRVDAAMKQLTEASNKEKSGGAFTSTAKSIEKAKYELYQFESLIGRAEATSRLGKQFGDTDTSGLDKAIERLKTYKAELQQIADVGKSSLSGKERKFDAFALDAGYKEAVDQVRKLSQEQHNSEMNLGRYNQMLAETNALWDRIIAAWVKGSSLHVASDNMQPAERQAHDFYQRLKSLNEADMGNVQIISQLAAEFQRLKGTLTATAKEQEKLNAATEKQRAKDSADAARKAQKEDEAWAKSMREASTEANKLGIELNKLRKIEASGSAVGVDTNQLRQYIHQLELYKTILDQIASGYKGVGHASGWINGSEKVSGYDTLGNTGRLAREAASAVRELTAEKQRATSSTSQLTSEEHRLAQALNQTAESAKGQSQVLSDLKSMAMQYLGVWGGQQFLHNIIEIGGQLEMQRMSIGAILQNQSQANDLFEKIKGLAVQSPFGVVELDQMTKQLTAYGFKYSELFDMTKRLADISAATGTGVDRLALALGHVKSEAALSGYTLRQFAMGNVPLLAKLSEKLGKTTQEIRKMVRAKEISYEDVEGVIKDLTNQGGMFYNMQETISKSVKARFKNVKDAMAIMYGEMAESGVGDALKSVADALMEITKNWKDVATVVGTGVAVWAIQRSALLALNFALGNNTSALTANILAYKQKRAAELQNEAMIRKLTAEEAIMVKTRNQITAANIRLALSNGAVTKGETLKLIALRKINIEEAKALIRTGELTAAEVRLALQGRILGISFGKAGAAVKLFGQRLWAATSALLTNPWTWAIAGLSAMVELWQRNAREMEKAQEVADSVYNRSQDALQNTRRMMAQTGISVYNSNRENITNSFGLDKAVYKFLPEFDASTAEQVMEEWATYIRDYAATPNRILNESLFDSKGNVLSLKDAFEKLGHAVLMVSDAQEELARTSDVFAAAQEATNGGWFDDDVSTDLKDYENALKKFNASVTKDYMKFRKQADEAIKFAREQDKGFKDATQGMQTYAEMLSFLIQHMEDYTVAAGVMSSKGWNLAEYAKPLGDAEKEAKKEVDAYIEALKAGLEMSGVNIAEMTPAQQQVALLGFKEFLSKAGVQAKKSIDYWIKYFADKTKIEGEQDSEKIVERLADWQKRAQNVFSVNQTIKVKTKTVTDIDEFAQTVQKDLKEKQEYINRNASHIRHVLNIKTGVKFDLSTIDDQIIALSAQVQKLLAQGKVEAAQSINSIIQDELMPYHNALKSIQEDKNWLKSEGYPEKDPTKTKTKGSKGTQTYKDPVAEEWKERIRLLKDANSLYKEWNKREGEDEALNRVRKQYGDIFEKWKTDKNVPWKDFKAEDIIEYRNYIQKIVDEAQSSYNSQRNDKSKNYGKAAEAVLREGKKLLDDIDKYDFDEKAKDFASAASKSIDQLTKRWEIFKSVAETTGDKSLASQLAGFGDIDKGARTAAEAMRNELIKQIRELGGEGVLAKIPFDIDLDEESLRDQFLNAINEADNIDKYKESISGLVKMYQEWQKLQQAVLKDDTGAFAKVVGLAKSYEAQIRKINNELEDTLASIAANQEATEQEKKNASDMATADAEWKKMKLSADYANIHNNAIAMSATEYKHASDKLKSLIDRLRELSEMSPEEFISEMNAIRKSQIDRSTAPSNELSAFVTGGAAGLKTYYERLMNKALEDMSRARVGSAEYKRAKEEYDDNSAKAAAIEEEIAEIQAAQAALDGLRKAADMVANFFEAIGSYSSSANAAGSIAGGAMSGASSLASFGKWGFAAGAIIGGATAMVQAGDKAAERAIKDLQGDIQVIEADVSTIATQRERTLGYDNLSYLQRLYQMSAENISKYSGANPFNSSDEKKQFHAGWGAELMRDFYSDLFGNANTGYQAQYDALLKQRENYYAILDKQNEKKNKSNEEIAETQKRIAELDDQIAYFAQDLAKELWSIDIKGWADQLSDALASAFENGENMAKAYRDTVTSIIQQMMQKMMQMAILEPMFERLQTQLFGDGGANKGVFDPNNPKGSMSKITAMIADYFGKGGEGEKAITASMEFMTAFQRGMQNAGLTVLNEASNTLSSSMQGTTEETSGLLAGYVNALRQDVSINRIMLNQFVSQMWPDYIETFSNQVTAVQNIDSNVQVIMTMMQLGNGAMYEQIAAMRSRFDNICLGIDRVSIK